MAADGIIQGVQGSWRSFILEHRHYQCRTPSKSPRGQTAAPVVLNANALAALGIKEAGRNDSRFEAQNE